MNTQPLTDLRQYIEALRALGELQEIDVPVALDLELAAIARRCYETGAAAPLFKAFSDHPGGMRILGAPAGLSAKPGQELIRVATSLELPPDSSGLDIAEAIAASLALPAVAPVIVDDAPCFQNVATGDAVDLMRLPLPLLHRGDGGRYLNTWGCIVARTPDGAWTNWSIARMMRVDGRRLSGIVAPAQHLGMIAQAWADIGQPMPFALALGVEPAIPFICGMPLPAHVDEAGRLGALMRRAIRTVRCRTVPLEAPASAEILVEGHLHLDQTVEEGPMGEFAGYVPVEPPMRRPVYQVSAISHRDDAILPVVVAGEPVEENHTAWGIPSSAQLLYELRQGGIPATAAWIPLQAALHWLVVTVPRDWRRRTRHRRQHRPVPAHRRTGVRQQGRRRDPEGARLQRRRRPHRCQGAGLGLRHALPPAAGQCQLRAHPLGAAAGLSAPRREGHGHDRQGGLQRPAARRVGRGHADPRVLPLRLRAGDRAARAQPLERIRLRPARAALSGMRRRVSTPTVFNIRSH